MAAANVLMVFPRFNQNSFWSLQAACDIYGVKCPAPPLGMMTMAAMLPKDWTIKLVNRNAEELHASAGGARRSAAAGKRPDGRKPP